MTRLVKHVSCKPKEPMLNKPGTEVCDYKGRARDMGTEGSQDSLAIQPTQLLSECQTSESQYLCTLFSIHKEAEFEDNTHGYPLVYT